MENGSNRRSQTPNFRPGNPDYRPETPDHLLDPDSSHERPSRRRRKGAYDYIKVARSKSSVDPRSRAGVFSRFASASTRKFNDERPMTPNSRPVSPDTTPQSMPKSRSNIPSSGLMNGGWADDPDEKLKSANSSEFIPDDKDEKINGDKDSKSTPEQQKSTDDQHPKTENTFDESNTTNKNTGNKENIKNTEHIPHNQKIPNDNKPHAGKMDDKKNTQYYDSLREKIRNRMKDRLSEDRPHSTPPEHTNTYEANDDPDDNGSYKSQYYFKPSYNSSSKPSFTFEPSSSFKQSSSSAFSKPPPSPKTPKIPDPAIDKNQQKIMNEISDALEKAWKFPEAKRKKVIKKIRLKWHPDKNINNELLANEITQHIQFEMERLEQGLPLGGATSGSAFFSSGNPFANCSEFQSNFERAYQFYQDQMNARPKERREEQFRDTYSKTEDFHKTTPQATKERATKFFRKAQRDLKSAHNDYDTQEPAFEWVCMKAHQAAEKALKAAQFLTDGIASFSHDLRTLAETMDDTLRILADKLQSIIGDAYTFYNPDPSDFDVSPHEKFTREKAANSMTISRDILKKVRIMMGIDEYE